MPTIYAIVVLFINSEFQAMLTLRDFHFAFPLRVRFAEVDSQGVVFNAHYLTYFDTALTEYMRYLGMNVSIEGNPKDKDFQLIKTTLEYKAPARFDDQLKIAVRVQRIGNSSIVFDVAAFSIKNEQLLVCGDLVWVYTDLLKQTSVAIPTETRAFFESAKA